MSNRHFSRNAFSLIEIMIVFLILSVLLSMLLPAIQKVREAAAKAECMNNLKQIGIAMHTFQELKGHFPKDEDAVVAHPITTMKMGAKTRSNYEIHWQNPPELPAAAPAYESFYSSVLPYLDETNQLSLQDRAGQTRTMDWWELMVGSGFVINSANHGLTTGMRVNIAGVKVYMSPDDHEEDSPLNGTWDVQVLSPSRFLLVDSEPARKGWGPHGGQWTISGDSLADNPLTVKSYLCPSRRTPELAGPRDDYGCATHPDANAKCSDEFRSTTVVSNVGSFYSSYPFAAEQPAASPLTDAVPKTALRTYSVLGWGRYYDPLFSGLYGAMRPYGVLHLYNNLPEKSGVKLKEIKTQDGASNTLLLAHKGMSPKNYAGGVNDEGWATVGNAAQHKRKPDAFLRDQNIPNIEFMMSSPHTSMPCLWVDGRVSCVSYNISSDQLWPLWSYNDKIAVDVP